MGTKNQKPLEKALIIWSVDNLVGLGFLPEQGET